MPICTTCAHPVSSLFIRYGKDHVVLAPCTYAAPVGSSSALPPDQPTTSIRTSRSAGEAQQEPGSKVLGRGQHEGTRQGCGAFADPYLEHGLAIVILDLILVKPRAYRHLLFNRPNVTLPTESQLLRDDAAERPQVPMSVDAVSNLKPVASATRKQQQMAVRQRWITLCKRLLALLLLDTYIRWFDLCVHRSTLPDGRVSSLDRELEGKLCSLDLRSRLAHSLDRRWNGTGKAYQAEWTARGGGIVQSYMAVLLVTMVEVGAFHLVVGSLCWLAVTVERRWQLRAALAPSGGDTTKAVRTDAPISSARPLDLYTADLAPTSMLLSQLSTLLLLSLVLLWNSKFPRSDLPPSTHPPETSNAGSAGPLPLPLVWLDDVAERIFDRLPKWTVDWTIRTVVGGLSAGVALGVVLPQRPVVSTAVLFLAWAGQASAARWFVGWIVEGT